MQEKEEKQFETLEQALNYKEFENEFEAVTINNDIPITITDKDRQMKEGETSYTDAKKEGRSGKGVAVISINTLAVYTSENIKYDPPINWTKTIQRAKIYNKSHIIGYRLSAKINNFNNIFIGTNYLNKTSMYGIEQKIYNDIKNNKRKYLYKVTPVYKFGKDYVPFGILIEAETIDKLGKKTICKFCYNIQKGYKINYYDGSNKPLERVLQEGREVKKIKDDKEIKSDEGLKFRDYIIDTSTNTFHSFRRPCEEIEKQKFKYKQETTADRDEVLNIMIEENGIKKQKYKFCEKCVHFK